MQSGSGTADITPAKPRTAAVVLDLSVLCFCDMDSYVRFLMLKYWADVDENRTNLMQNLELISAKQIYF
jgi:hypothetical protein